MRNSKLFKNIIFASIILLFSTKFFAQKQIFIDSSKKKENKVELISSNKDKTVLHFKTNSFQINKNGSLYANNMSSILKKGKPDFPKFSQSIIIPDAGKMELNIVSSDFKDFQNINISPSRGAIKVSKKNIKASLEYDNESLENGFFPKQISILNKPHILRDFRGQVINVFPFSYNPTTKTLRVYYNVIVEITSTNKAGLNELIRHKELFKIDAEFDKIYKRQFINYNTGEKYTPVEENGKMIILCHDDFTDEMEEFALWKNQRGLQTEIVPVSTVGLTSTLIKNYVTDQYNNHNLKYLLIVGDYQQIISVSDASTNFQHSDIAYAFVSGDDYYPDFFVGRISAQTSNQVTNQVTKMINYEKYPLQDNFYGKYLSIADSIQASGGGPGGDDGEYDWEHLRNIEIDLNSFTYNGGTELFDGDQGGDDAVGNPLASDVSSAVNAGCGLINYVGIGGDEWWGTTDFMSNDALQLTNVGKYPFIWSSSKEDGYFAAQDFTCLAEAWMRAENNGEPTGAIGMFSSTVEQYWQPPMDAQDEMIDILTSETGKRTYGGITYNGCMHMNDEYADLGYYMTTTWVLFGDPSLTVRTAKPEDMIISHNPVIFSEDAQFIVNRDFDGALACISLNGNIVGTANSTSGTITIPVSGLNSGDIVKLVVTGFNKNPYIVDINVINKGVSKVVVNDYSINGAKFLEFGQTDNIDLSLMNVGTMDATNVSANLSTTDSYISSITNNTFNYGNITGNNGTTTSSNSYTITLANNVPDQHIINFDVNISGNTKETWTEPIEITANAPQLTIGSFRIDDTATGNSNGILDPNETADFIFYTKNEGHATVTNFNSNLILLGGGSEITINNASFYQENLKIDSLAIAKFNVTAGNIPANTSFDMQYNATAGEDNQYSLNNTQTIIISYVATYCNAGADDTGTEFISNVKFGDIDNSSTLGGVYNDYTNLSTDIAVGNTYQLTVTNGDHDDSDDVACWIDWNYDGDFDDANETINIAYSNPYGIANITVPEGAHIGTTRMRIRLLWAYDETAEACGNASYGEVEDYSVNVLSVSSIKNTINSQEKFDFKIFPNPTKSILNIIIPEIYSKMSNFATFEIINISGELIKHEHIYSPTTQINLSSLNPGIYFINVNTPNGVVSKKIIIQ